MVSYKVLYFLASDLYKLGVFPRGVYAPFFVHFKSYYRMESINYCRLYLAVGQAEIPPGPII